MNIFDHVSLNKKWANIDLNTYLDLIFKKQIRLKSLYWKPSFKYPLTPDHSDITAHSCWLSK